MRFENLPDINISMYKTKTTMDKELQNVTKCLSTYIHKLKKEVKLNKNDCFLLQNVILKLVQKKMY